jgi:hypothetical protein
MSYKVFYNMGNDSDFFNACRPTAGAPLNTIYRCCKESCKSSPICSELCTNLYPGTLIEDCSYKSGCWNSGYFNPVCVKENSAKIRTCCLGKCRAGELSSFGALSSQISDARGVIDCDDYCSNYDVING